MDTASIIRTARQRAGLTQRGLAERAGTSAAAVCLYESGQRVPRVDTLQRLVSACGSSLELRLGRRTPTLDLAATGRALAAVLDLASHLPRRSSEQLDAPIFAELAS